MADRSSHRNDIYIVPSKFEGIKDLENKKKYIQYLLSLANTKLKEAIYDQDLHSHYLLARYVQSKILKVKNSTQHDEIKSLSDVLNKEFNVRIKKGGKLNKIKNDSKKFLSENNKKDKNFLRILATKTKNLLRNDSILEEYENHYNYEMSQIQKNILLRKFSSLNDDEQNQFISILFLQTPDIIDKVIHCQSLHDLKHMLNYTIPQERQKLKQLSEMILDYMNSVKKDDPHLKAQSYLNSKKELLQKAIPHLRNMNYEQCQINPAGDSYVIKLINKDIVNSIEDVDENIIMHYAVESSIESNLNTLKETLFPQTKNN